MLMLKSERLNVNHFEKFNLVLSELVKYRGMPVNTVFQRLWRFLDTRLRGYDRVGCTWARGPHCLPHDPRLSSSCHSREGGNPASIQSRPKDRAILDFVPQLGEASRLVSISLVASHEKSLNTCSDEAHNTQVGEPHIFW